MDAAFPLFKSDLLKNLKTAPSYDPFQPQTIGKVAKSRLGQIPLRKTRDHKLMKLLIERFTKDQSGAVTVDWVVLTAAVVGLGLAVLMPIAFETDNLSAGIGASIGNRSSGYVPSTP